MNSGARHPSNGVAWRLSQKRVPNSAHKTNQKIFFSGLIYCICTGKTLIFGSQLRTLLLFAGKMNPVIPVPILIG
jgi:hypothetical protein